MLTPDYLSQFSEPVQKLMESAQERIVADMARRIAKMGAVSYTTKWQAYKAQELRALRNEITREFSAASKRAEKEIPGLFERAADVALAADDEIYRIAGKPPPTDAHVSALRKTLEAGIRNTLGELRNFTRTIANTTTKQFENALDRAYIDVISGAFSPEHVVRREVKQLAAEGMKVIRYPSGHVDYLDVAIRRAVTTGVNQTCGALSLQYADEMGCDLVQVSSHIGARPEHAVWQGGIYSRSGKHHKYPDFVSSTGYGSGAGLCGWNCHHHFYPFFEGLSADTYTRYDPKENEVRYVQTQTQREHERRIRKSKRELAALDSAIKAAPNDATRDALQADFTRAASTLKRRETALREFLRSTPLPRRQYREQVDGFGRSQSGKAVWAARKGLKNASGNSTIKQTPFIPAKTLADAEMYAKSELGIARVSYKGCDISTANAWNKGLKESFERFPELKKNFGFVGECHQRNALVKETLKNYYLTELQKGNPGVSLDILVSYADKEVKRYMNTLRVSKDTFAQSWAPKKVPLSDFKGISVNADWGKDSERFINALRSNVKISFHPVGCDTIQSVLDHEVGHQLDELLDLRNNQIIRRLYDIHTKETLTLELSQYAWDNKNANLYSEMIAEAWAEYCNNPTPREIARTVGEEVEKIYAKKFGR